MKPLFRWRLTHEAADGVTLIGFQGRAVQLHPQDVAKLRRKLLPLAEKAADQHLMLDLGNVAYLTSDMIEALLDLYRRLHSRGGRLSVCRPTPAVAEILAALRLNTLLDVRTDLPTAPSA